jgi:tetratricopeptide (TPR) repeat protein
MALILNASICGFFAGYLLTRLFLAGAFYIADAAHRWLQQQTQAAQVLADAGAHDKAASQYEKVLQGVDSSTPKEVKREIYEGLVYNALYQGPPEGFEAAIKYARQYISGEPNSPSGKIFAFLAAAYGQQYLYEAAHENRPAVLQAARDGALDAIKQAIALDPGQKTLLTMLWNHNDRMKPPEENDLEVFFEDPEFRTILGS